MSNTVYLIYSRAYNKDGSPFVDPLSGVESKPMLQMATLDPKVVNTVLEEQCPISSIHYTMMPGVDGPLADRGKSRTCTDAIDWQWDVHCVKLTNSEEFYAKRNKDSRK